MISVIISFILVIVGALNWLCVGFFQYDFVAGIFGTQASIFSRIVYILIGVASIWLTYAVIRYKATLQTMSKKIDNDINKATTKVMNKMSRSNASTEASEEFSDHRAKKHKELYTSHGYDYANSRKYRDYYEDDEDSDDE